MKMDCTCIFLFVLMATWNYSCSIVQNEESLRLCYNEPADTWLGALPLGNGRLGAMPDGGVFSEKITLNNLTNRLDSAEDARDPEALRCLSQIRLLLLSGRNKEAQELTDKYFVCGKRGSALSEGADVPCDAYRMLGNLNIKYMYRDTDSKEYSGYERELSLKDAVARTKFRLGETKYEREYFVSHADDLIVIRFSSDKKRKLNFDIGIDHPERFTCYANDDVVYMVGELANQTGDPGTKYMAQMKVVLEDGTLLADSAMIHVNNASVAYIFVSAGTNFRDDNFEDRVTSLLDKADRKNYEVLKHGHVAAYQEKFKRMEIEPGKRCDTIPADKKPADFQKQDAPGISALYSQFGYYLMICGNRENPLMLNLQ